MIIKKVTTLIVTLTVCSALNAQVKVIGYVSNSENENIDYDKITHLNVAFENPDEVGNLGFSAVDQFYITQAHAKGKKVLVSIGGGSVAENAVMKNRYFTLLANGNRTSFVNKIVTYIKTHNFDGLDVDLEGPVINGDYGKFIADLSAGLKPEGKLLSAALSHANGGANVPDVAMLLFDYINIMAYDATGPWNPSNPGQHSSFDFAKTSLDYWLNRGLPKVNAILGVPFYGYGFGADFNQGMSYSQIVNTYAGAENRDVSGNTIYYNGLPTMREKAQYVVNNQYGGIMIWNLSQDLISTDAKSLLRAIDEIVNLTTELAENEDDDVNIYPNPTDAFLSVKSWRVFRGGEIKIIDSTAKEYMAGKVIGSDIDVSPLPSGLYILCLTKGKRSATKKFLKIDPAIKK